METRDTRHIIASYVAPRGFAPRVRAALEGLGYRLVPAATRGRFDDTSWRPDLRLVDERHLGRLPSEPDGVPIVCVADDVERCPDDPRIVGLIPRPVDVAHLYPVLQEALEARPRSAARAPTRIPSRCALDDRRWTADLVALSERGGLLRARADLAPDDELNLLFPLPLGRTVSTRARVVTHGPNGTAVSFQAQPPAVRVAIAEYVERRLATL